MDYDEFDADRISPDALNTTILCNIYKNLFKLCVICQL